MSLTTDESMGDRPMATEKRAKQGGGEDAAQAGMERLQKVIAARGVSSRRAAAEIIVEGRVSVNGRTVRELGTKVDPSQVEIRVDGQVLRQPRLKYLLLNKPRGYLTTASDPEGRRTVYDLLAPHDVHERVFPVGRLDMDSEGMLLLTNDGEFANRIAHPRHQLDKEYHALVTGHPSGATLAHLRRGGFMVDGGRTSPAVVEVLEQSSSTTLLKVIIHEGRRRQVRRIMEEVGHPVQRLRRVRLGPLTLAGLPAAAYRPLTTLELTRLRKMVGLDADGVPVQGEGEEAEVGYRRVNEPRALAGRKPIRQGRGDGETGEVKKRVGSRLYRKLQEHGGVLPRRPVGPVDDGDETDEDEQPIREYTSRPESTRPTGLEDSRPLRPGGNRPSRPEGNRSSRFEGERPSGPMGGRPSQDAGARPARQGGAGPTEQRGSRPARSGAGPRDQGPGGRRKQEDKGGARGQGRGEQGNKRHRHADRNPLKPGTGPRRRPTTRKAPPRHRD